VSLLSIRAVTLAVLFCASAAAQNPEQERQLSAGRDLRALGHYREALQVFTNLLRDAEQHGAAAVFEAAILDDLAVTEQGLGNFAAAETRLTRSIAILKASGASARETAPVEGHLGEVYLEEGRPREAEPLFRRVLETRQKETPADPANTAVALADLAMARKHLGKLGEAETLLRKAVALLENRFGPDHPMVASILGPLASTLTKQTHYKEALALTERTWRILSKDPRVADPDLINTMSALGFLYCMTGQPKEAEFYARQAVAKAEAIYGPDHARLGWHLANYADVMKRIGHKNEAKAAQQRATAILARNQQANPVRHTVNVNALR
jgi:tetratricopeptide (TPR) repeat protein